MRALAECAIEHELGVKSQMTVWGEHLYELEGFRELFGPEVVDELKQGRQVGTDRLLIPERLSLRLQGEKPYASFGNLRASVESAVGGIVVIGLRSDDDVVMANVILDFNEERLILDAMHNIRVREEDSERAVLARIHFLQYLKRWIANGVSEIWNPAADKRLGRSEPVMLVNMMPGPLIDAIDGGIAELQARLDRPEATDSEGEDGTEPKS